MALLSFLSQYKWIILFYLLIVVFFVAGRKHVMSQAKIIFLYRTTFGIHFIEKFSEKFREWVKLYGLSGVGVGFLGMIMISVLLVGNLVHVLASSGQPSSVTSVSVVLPGVEVPGLGVLPFWYWLLAIFVIMVVHEFSHGIVAHAHGIKVNWTGIVLFGPIIGAFVEPDEKKLTNESDVIQYSTYAAGAFSNILLAVIVLLLLMNVSFPLQQSMVEPIGFTFDSYIHLTKESEMAFTSQLHCILSLQLSNLRQCVKDRQVESKCEHIQKEAPVYDQCIAEAQGLKPPVTYPFEEAGIVPGTKITGINDVNVTDFSEFGVELLRYRAGDAITVRTADQNYSIKLASHPFSSPSSGFLGIKEIKNQFAIDERYQSGVGYVVYTVLEWFNGIEKNGRGFLLWLYVLSFGIGLFNLLPLPIVDGGRMLQTLMRKLYGVEVGDRRYAKIGFFFLALLVLSLLMLLF